MKILPILAALSLGLAVSLPAAQASTLIGGAWTSTVTLPQDDGATVTQSGREGGAALPKGR